MRRKLIVCVVVLLISFSSSLCKQIPAYVGIFYTRDIPESAFYMYDWLIVNPDLFSMQFLKEKFYLKRRAKLIAYMSVEEIEKNRVKQFGIEKDWVIGENKIWHSVILDLRKEGYRKLLLDKIIPSLISKGYEGLMLDTLDSYQIALPEERWVEYEKKEIELTKEIKKRYPDLILIVNRPFRIIDQIRDYVSAFLVESLFGGLDSKLNYTKMKPEDTDYLLNKLNHVRSLGVPVIVVDYVDPKKRELAKKVAKRIKKLGFIPWVTDKYLTVVGIGGLELIPRRIILFYNSKKEPEPVVSEVHRLVQLYLEWLGFVPELWDINKPLPERYLADKYRGIVVWTGEIEEGDSFYEWIKKRIDEGIKVFFINGFGFPAKKRYLSSLGIDAIINRADPFSKVRILEKKDIVGFEIEPEIKYSDVLLVPERGIPIITAINKAGQKFSPIAIMPWGGYAMEGSLIVNHGKNDLWVINPIKLFRIIFKPEFPAPDITTENGNRILTAHIDGDGFFGNANFDLSRSVAEVIRDEILNKYAIPHTVSVIEGEIAAWGLYPEKSRRLEKIAKSIFRLSNVEPASHTFSHPFYWKDNNWKRSTHRKYGRHLPVPNYEPNSIDIKREIIGSIEYIDKRLVPKEKRVKVLLWSGDCAPPREAVKMTYDIGVYNVNGGDTTITNSSPFLCYISPMGINRDGYFQVYAPIQKEDVYTNLWNGPFYGYINVISTFKLTDTPVRFKPISIYYHFYSGQKTASLKALKDVYKWALSQRINPMFLSEYAQRVLEFRATGIAKDGNMWIIRNGGSLKTLRAPSYLFPDLFKSKGVVGYKRINGPNYIHLDNSGDYRILLIEKDSNKFYLYDSNAQVRDFKADGNSIIIKLKGYIPIDVRFINKKGCRIKIIKGGKFEKSVSGDKVHYRFLKARDVIIKVVCS